MVQTRQLIKAYALMAIPFTGFLLGWKLDQMETERMTLFRDKSALYGREMKPGERPSWP